MDGTLPFLPPPRREGGGVAAVGPTPLVSINHAETSGNHLSALRHTNRMIYRPGLCVFLNLILIYLK